MGEKNSKNLEILYENPQNLINRPWESITAPCRIANLLSYQDIQYLNSIARSVKYRPKEKKDMITALMQARGFKRLAAGTNRVTYKYLNNQDFVVKVAFDSVALEDSPNEYRNQEYLKPFCAKCFEVTPCGTVGLFERVEPVMHVEEFRDIANDVFDIIVNCFIGKYALADFGTEFYKNWGVRVGSFPVILDYPYLYEIDPTKLTCDKPDPTSPTGYCGGDLDYDAGFNNIICTKCHKVYRAIEIAKKDIHNRGILYSGKEIPMKITIEKADGSVLVVGNNRESDTYKKKETRKEYKERKSLSQLKIYIEKADRYDEEEKPEPISETPVQEEIPAEEDKMFEPVDISDPEDNMKITITRRDGKVIKPNRFNSATTLADAYNEIYGTGVSEYNYHEDDEPSKKPEPKVSVTIQKADRSDEEEKPASVEKVSGEVVDDEYSAPLDIDPEKLAETMRGNTSSRDSEDAVTVYSSEDYENNDDYDSEPQEATEEQMDEFM